MTADHDPLFDQFQVVRRRDAKAAGLSLYFTGKPCSNGHVDFRRVSGGSCRACSRETLRRSRERNPERVREVRKKWTDENRETVNKKLRERRAAKPEQTKATRRSQRLANPEKHRDRSRKFYQANRPERLEYARAYRQANKVKRAAYQRSREAKKRGIAGSYTDADVARIRKEQRDRCAYCRVSLRGRGHVDHITPLSRGGSNDPRNIQIACQPCNQAKHAHDPIDFARKMGKLL